MQRGMMADDLTLAVRLTGDGKGLVEVIDAGSDELRRFAGEAKKTDKASRSASRGQDALAKSGKRAADTGKRLGTVYKGLGRTLMTTAAAYLSLRGAQNLVSAFESQEQAVAALEASIESMGRTTAGLSEQLQSLAAEIQRDGIIGDEAIIKGQSFLTTYSQITDDLLPRTTRIMADVAAKMGGDTVSAANLLGKASMGMTGELSRMGITLSDTAKETKDFRLILSEIEAQVGGMNSALAATSTGGIKQFANAWGDARERMGEALAYAAGPLLRELSTELDISQQTAEEWGQALFDTMESVATGTAGLVDTLQVPIGAIKDLAGDIWDGYTRLPSWAQEVGIIGALLGGKKGVLLLGALSKFVSDSKTTADWWDAYSSGKIGFAEWFTSGQDEAKARLQELREQGILVTEDLPSIPDALFPDDGGDDGVEQKVAAYFARVRAAMEDARLDREAERIFAEMDRFNAEFDLPVTKVNDFGAAVADMGDEWDKAFDLIEQQFEDLDDQEARAIAGLDNIGTAGADNFARLEAAARGWGDQFTNTLADMVTTGKANFADLANAIINDLARIVIYQAITKPLLSAMGVPGFGTTTASVNHTGGIAGEAGTTRTVPTAVFASAPRYHSGGIAGDEVPAILQRGEEVITRNDPRHRYNQGQGGGNVRVEVINRGSNEVRAEDAQVSLSPDGMVVSVVLDDLRRGGPMTQGLSRAFNLQRSV